MTPHLIRFSNVSNNFTLSIFAFPVFFLCAVLFSACGGGGGGDNEGVPGGGGRTTGTAIRVFHAGLDSAPVGLFLGEKFLTETKYLQNNFFFPVNPQDSLLRVTRTDRFSEPVADLPVNFAPNTEYSLFVYGAVKDGSFRVRLLEEPIIRPEPGLGRIQFLNGLSGAGDIRFTLTGPGAPPPVGVRFGTTSSFIDLPSGEYQLRAVSSGGVPLSSVPLTLPDRGELSVLVAGKLEYDFITLRIYEDFD